jgi:hypothetical protein
MPRKEVIQTSVVWYAHPDEMHEQTAYHDNSLSENLAKSTFGKASPTPSGMRAMSNAHGSQPGFP